jgi:dihydroorotase
VFIDRQLIPLRAAFPDLRIVFEHLTTKEAVEYVRDSDANTLGATLTAHHLLYNRNAIFLGANGASGLRPHYYCLPVLKREPHRQALLSAATSGDKHFFLGTDSAPHAKGAKETSCGCAGCYTALHALELYAEAFESVGKLAALEGFASFNGPDFYRLARNTGKVTLEREAWMVPEELPFGSTSIVPLGAGKSIGWKMSA